MPFTMSGSSFFNGVRPLTNSGNPMDIMSKASTTANSGGDLFGTIQAVRQNELERQQKQATISQALAAIMTAKQEMDLKQEAAPIENAYKIAQTSEIPSNIAYKQSQTGMNEAQAGMYNRMGNSGATPSLDDNGDMVIESWRTDKYGNLVPGRVTSKSAQQAKSDIKVKEADSKAAQKEQNLYASASGLITQLRNKYESSITPQASIPAQTNMADAAIGKFGAGLNRKFAAASGKDVSLNTYIRGRDGFTSQLRQLTGDSGVLTNQDVARIQGLLPGEFATAEEAEDLWNQIDQVISDGYRRAAARRSGSPMGFKDASSMSLEDMKKELSELTGGA